MQFSVELTQASQRRAARVAKYRGVSRDTLLAQLLTEALREAESDMVREEWGNASAKAVVVRMRQALQQGQI